MQNSKSAGYMNIANGEQKRWFLQYQEENQFRDFLGSKSKVDKHNFSLQSFPMYNIIIREVSKIQ